MIDPRYMDLQQWTDAVALTLATSAPIPKLLGDDWKLWADTVISTPTIARFTPPTPTAFSDWRQWAERFVESVPL